VFQYFLNNPDEVLQEFSEFLEYSVPERIAFYIARMSNTRFREVYNEVEPDLSKRIDRQYKFDYLGEESFEMLLNGQMKSLLDSFRQNEYEIVEIKRALIEDSYYDDEKQSLKNNNSYFRIRQKRYVGSDEGQYSATVKEKIERNGANSAYSVRQDHTVRLNTDELEMALGRMRKINANIGNYSIESTPSLKSSQSTHEIVLKRDDTMIRISLIECTFLDPKSHEEMGTRRQIEIRLRHGYFDYHNTLDECCSELQQFFEGDIQVCKESLSQIGHQILDEKRSREMEK